MKLIIIKSKQSNMITNKVSNMIKKIKIKKMKNKLYKN